MIQHIAFRGLSLFALSLLLSLGSLDAAEPKPSRNPAPAAPKGAAEAPATNSLDQALFLEYRAARIQQVQAMGEIWFPEWRVGTVAQTYRDLSQEILRIQRAGGSPRLQRHLSKAERTNTTIGTLFGQGGVTKIRPLIGVITPKGGAGAGAEIDTDPHGERGREIIRLLQELEEQESKLADELFPDH